MRRTLLIGMCLGAGLVAVIMSSSAALGGQSAYWLVQDADLTKPGGYDDPYPDTYYIQTGAYACDDSCVQAATGDTLCGSVQFEYFISAEPGNVYSFFDDTGCYPLWLFNSTDGSCTGFNRTIGYCADDYWEYYDP